MLRPAPRSASIGSVRVANHAGAAPKTMPVTSARPNANASTSGDGRVSIGRNVAPANASASSSRAAPIATTRPAMPPATASSTLSTSACVTICRRDAPIASRTAVCPRRATRAREQQVGDVGAGDQQHQPADAEQDLQAASVLLLHDRRRRRRPGRR